MPEAKDELGYSWYGFVNLGGGYWQAAEAVAAVAEPTDDERSKGWQSVVYAIGTSPMSGGGRLCALPTSDCMLLIEATKEMMLHRRRGGH